MSFGFMSLLLTLLSYCQILFMVGHQYNIEVASIFFLNDDLLYKLHVFCCNYNMMTSTAYTIQTYQRKLTNRD